MFRRWSFFDNQYEAPMVERHMLHPMIGVNRMSLRNNRLKFKSAGKLPIILEESVEEYTPI